MSKRPSKPYNTIESQMVSRPTGRKARRKAAKIARQEFVKQRSKKDGI
jgi:hypothetical protein|tara:strand:- start:87 stop:230 length:144 start_codon:yes stop_codon:yes gene_type:complete